MANEKEKNGKKAPEAERCAHRRREKGRGTHRPVVNAPSAPAATTPAQCGPSAPHPLTLSQRLKRTFGRSGHQKGKRAAWRTRLWVRALLCVLSPLVIVYACQLITLQDAMAAFAWFGAFPVPALLTYLVLLGALIALYAVTTSLPWSTAVVTVVPMGFAVASYLKEVVNGAPLMISDLAMAGRVGDVANFLRPGMQYGRAAWAAVLIAVAVLVLSAVFACRPAQRRASWHLRLGSASAALLGLILCLTLPSAKAFLLGPGNEIQAERNERLGLLAGLYSGYLDSEIQQPNAYNENNMNGILHRAELAKMAAHPGEKPEKAPNVILLMSESFCDPTAVLPHVEFGEDPIPNYRALAEQYPAGGFLSNSYAGGTGNVEMEVMTGVPIAYVSSGEDLTSLKDETAYDRMPSIVKAFAAQGYTTEFVHSYNDRLYSRAEHVPVMGFEKAIFEEDFPKNAERKGPYLSDMALTKQIIHEFENKPSDEPLFLFGLSMENHQPYYGEKFSRPSGLDYDCNRLDENGMETLDALLHGLNDADEALGALTDYFAEQDEPTIIVFWGDHLPGLNTGMNMDSLYVLLGYVGSDDTKSWSLDEMKQMHTTRYLVWNNYGAELAVPEEMSTLQLGTRILDWAHIEKPLYFHWVDRAMDDMILYCQRLFINGGGEPSALPEKNDRVAGDYRNIVYDMIYGEQYITEDLLSLPPRK